MPLPQVNHLSSQERLALIGELWDSLDEAEVTVTPAQQAELESRLATLAADREAAVTWEDLRTELRQRLR